MEKPKFKKIRELCTEKSFKRGKRYWEEGRILNIEKFRNRIDATVMGSKDYEVTLELDRPDFRAQCTCPYDWGGYCKHVVATLIALSEDYEKIGKVEEKTEEKIDSILENLGARELRDFMRKEFQDNHELRDRFSIYFTGEAARSKSIHDYKNDIDALYRNAADSEGWIEYDTRIDFFPLTDIAKKFEDKENFVEAAKIYRALFETIVENMDMVDDSSGHYGFTLAQQLDNYISCMRKIARNHNDRKKYLEYLLDKYIEADLSFIREDIESAIWKLNESKKDFEYLEKLLSPHIPSTIPNEDEDWDANYDALELVKTKLHILSELKSGRELLESTRKYRREDPSLCISLAKELEKKGRIKEAITILEEGLETFSRSETKHLQTYLKKLCKERDD